MKLIPFLSSGGIYRKAIMSRNARIPDDSLGDMQRGGFMPLSSDDNSLKNIQN